ncbi:MAG TPA: hypothetical protein VK588_13770, partial [Chitinophagaceae bacterium]|nr:hypothetical protein [Chitinophagaceae bacterium]
PGEAAADKYDPNRPFFYIDQDGMAVIGLATLGRVDRPEMPDAELAGDLLETTREALENPKEGISTIEPDDDKSKTTKPAQDAKVIDPKRFSRKGAIYYDRELNHNILRDTDTTGTLTDLPAKDTLR